MTFGTSERLFLGIWNTLISFARRGYGLTRVGTNALSVEIYIPVSRSKSRGYAALQKAQTYLR